MSNNYTLIKKNREYIFILHLLHHWQHIKIITDNNFDQIQKITITRTHWYRLLPTIEIPMDLDDLLSITQNKDIGYITFTINIEEIT